VAQTHQANRAAAGEHFPQTAWSVVLLAGDNPSTQSAEALATLCQAYWYPLYSFVRRQGYSPHDAEDLTQGFFAHLLEQPRLSKARREKGRFRSFLLAALRNFLADQRDKAAAQKRGGNIPIISLDAQTAEQRYHLEPSDERDPEKLFERQWALSILDRVLARLESEYGAAGKSDRFKLLHPLLLGEEEALAYSEIGRRLDMSVAAVKMAILRLRTRSRELFRAEVINTLAEEKDVADEVKRLSAALAG
jgi:RNA polymerase sigma-70 factor (ECF subfamily)